MARSSRGSRRLVEADLEMLPFMSLFVVLIPMLLLSAVFLEISVIDLALPGDAETAEPPPGLLALEVAILEGAYVIRGAGAEERTVPRAGREAWRVLSAHLVELGRGHAEKALTIVSEPGTRYEDIIEVMDASRQAGIPQVSLAGAAS
jgi:biopolymer transport protein ExbD